MNRPALELEYWVRVLTCRFRQKLAWAFHRHPIDTPLPAVCPSSVHTGLKSAKVTAVRLQATAAAKPDESPDRIHQNNSPARRTMLVVHRDRTWSGT